MAQTEQQPMEKEPLQAPEHDLDNNASPRFKEKMQTVVTVALLAAGLFVVLSGYYKDGTVNWATSVITLVAAFWLRGFK